jgi:hypothetical protein
MALESLLPSKSLAAPDHSLRRLKTLREAILFSMSNRTTLSYAPAAPRRVAPSRATAARTGPFAGRPSRRRCPTAAPSCPSCSSRTPSCSHQKRFATSKHAPGLLVGLRLLRDAKVNNTGDAKVRNTVVRGATRGPSLWVNLGPSLHR